MIWQWHDAGCGWLACSHQDVADFNLLHENPSFTRCVMAGTVSIKARRTLPFRMGFFGDAGLQVCTWVSLAAALATLFVLANSLGPSTEFISGNVDSVLLLLKDHKYDLSYFFKEEQAAYHAAPKCERCTCWQSNARQTRKIRRDHLGSSNLVGD